MKTQGPDFTWWLLNCAALCVIVVSLIKGNHEGHLNSEAYSRIHAATTLLMEGPPDHHEVEVLCMKIRSSSDDLRSTANWKCLWTVALAAGVLWIGLSLLRK